jgi:hypothetical protein
MTDPMRPTGRKLCTLSVWYFHRFSMKPPREEQAGDGADDQADDA